eukprot:1044762-Prymnesium_polylepis.1
MRRPAPNAHTRGQRARHSSERTSTWLRSDAGNRLSTGSMYALSAARPYHTRSAGARAVDDRCNLAHTAARGATRTCSATSC